MEECMQSIVIGIDLAIAVKKHGWKPSWSDAGNSVLEKACKAVIKVIYSEKATKFCEIFTLLLIAVHTVKSKVKILQNFVAFQEYMNFKKTSG